MDPLSVAVAFAGFSASLITILETTTKVSMKLIELQRKFKELPKKISQLCRDLDNLHTLLEAIQIRCSIDEAVGHTPGLQGICETFINELENDVKDLQAVVDDAHRKSKFPISKEFKVKLRHLSAEHTIDGYRGRISAHIGKLILVQNLIHASVFSQSWSHFVLELIETSSKVDDIRQTSVAILDETKVMIALMDTHISVLNSRNQHKQLGKAMVSMYSAPEVREQERLSLVEVCKDKKTHEFGLGSLTLQTYRNWKFETAEGGQFQLKITFVPPFWLSQTALRIIIRGRVASPFNIVAPEICLKPVTINNNPQLLDALHKQDASQLRRLFETKQVQPRDMVMDMHSNNPITLSETILRMCSQITPCTKRLHMQRAFFSLLVDQGVPISIEAALVFFLGVGIRLDKSGLAQYYLENFMNTYTLSTATIKLSTCKHILPLWSIHIQGGCSWLPALSWLDVSTRDGKADHSFITVLAEGTMSFDCLKRFLIHDNQAWQLGDLTDKSLWYVAVLVHTDRLFHKSVHAYLASFRSALNRSSRRPIESLMNSAFNIGDVVGQVETASRLSRTSFLGALARKGTPQMLEPFLSGVDLDERIDDAMSYLTSAIMMNNVNVSRLLLDAGASSVLGIPAICELVDSDQETYKEQFCELLDALRFADTSTRNTRSTDPVHAILSSKAALSIRPDALHLLITHGWFSLPRLYGSPKTYLFESYILNAIRNHRAEALRMILAHRSPPLDRTLASMFYTSIMCKRLRNYTWLTLAVDLGRPECVELFLFIASSREYAVFHSDGDGRTALQIAEANVQATHPRRTVFHSEELMIYRYDTLASAAQDEEVLRVVRAAAGPNVASVHPQSTAEIATTRDNSVKTSEITAVQSPAPPYIYYKLKDRVVKAACFALDSIQFSSRGLSSPRYECCNDSDCSDVSCRCQQIRRNILQDWTELNQMGFLEALVLRVCYLGMVFLVLLYDLMVRLVAFKNAGRFSKPSQGLTTVLLVVVIVLNWGT